MKIAYVYMYSPFDRRVWSGIPYYMLAALKRLDQDIEVIAPLDMRAIAGWRLLSQVFPRVFRKQFSWERIPSVAKKLAKQVDSRLEHSKCNVILSPSSLLIPYIQDRRPKAFWTDATYQGMVGFYFRQDSVFRWSHRNAVTGEVAAIEAADVAIYSSEWAAASAASCSRKARANIAVVPFGANIDREPTRLEVEMAIAKRAPGQVRLLFVGTDWFRKRAQFAIEVAQQLAELGVNVSMDLVGCECPADFVPPDFVRVHGFVSKNSEEGRLLLSGLYQNAHFFILPSEAEACAVVLAEALAFGVPSVGTDVGGMSTIVRNGISGRLFARSDGVGSYAKYIRECTSDCGRYWEMAASSRRLYENELNWNTAADRVSGILRGVAR